LLSDFSEILDRESTVLGNVDQKYRINFPTIF